MLMAMFMVVMVACGVVVAHGAESGAIEMPQRVHQGQLAAVTRPQGRASAPKVPRAHSQVQNVPDSKLPTDALAFPVVVLICTESFLPALSVMLYCKTTPPGVT